MKEQTCGSHGVQLFGRGNPDGGDVRRAGLGFDAGPADLKILRCADRTRPRQNGISGSDGGNESMLQYAELADQALLLLLTQTGIAASPQKAVPAPGPDEKTFDSFFLGARGSRGVDDVHAETVEYLSLLPIRETNDEAFTGFVLRRLGLDAEAPQSGQESRTKMLGPMLENE